jgi:hypothetical protein
MYRSGTYRISKTHPLEKLWVKKHYGLERKKYAPIIARFGGNPFPKDKMPPTQSLVFCWFSDAS